MKLFCVIAFVCLISSSFQAAVISKDHFDKVKALLTECQEEENASIADLNKLMLGGFPESREGLCMIACVNEKVGIVSLVK